MVETRGQQMVQVSGSLLDLPPSILCQAVVLGTFVEDPAQMAVATFGDGSLGATSSAAALTGHESEVGHELTWMREAVDVADLTDGDHRSDCLITFKPHESEHDGLHVPLIEQGFHVHLQSLDALGCGIDALQILTQALPAPSPFGLRFVQKASVPRLFSSSTIFMAGCGRISSRK